MGENKVEIVLTLKFHRTCLNLFDIIKDNHIGYLNQGNIHLFIEISATNKFIEDFKNHIEMDEQGSFVIDPNSNIMLIKRNNLTVLRLLF